MGFAETLICVTCIGILIAYFMWKSHRQDKAKEREHIYNTILQNLISTYVKMPNLFASFNEYNRDPMQIEIFIMDYVFKTLQDKGHKDISLITFCGDIERLPDIRKSLKFLKEIYILGLRQDENFGLIK